MGIVCRLVESVLIVAIWFLVSTVTGCSKGQIIDNCQKAANVLETYDIQLPHVSSAEVFMERSTGNFWEAIKED